MTKTDSKTKEKAAVRKEIDSYSSSRPKTSQAESSAKLPKLNAGSSFSFFLADLKAAQSK